jgi:hypothetical protein
MGTRASCKVAISMLIALFAIVIDTVLGLRSVDSDVLDRNPKTPMCLVLRGRDVRTTKDLYCTVARALKAWPS